MKKHRVYSVVMSLIMALSFFAIIPFSNEPLIASADDYEYATFPLTKMDLVCIAFEKGGDAAHDGSFHIDCSVSGTDGYVHAPFTGYIVNYTSNYSACLFQSANEVYFADGSRGYMTVCLEHGSNISELQSYYQNHTLIQKGTPFYHAGGVGAGGATTFGVHFDFGVCRGKVNTFSPQNTYARNHGLTYSGTGDTFAFDAFYIDRSFTQCPSYGSRGYGIIYGSNNLVGIPDGVEAIRDYNGRWRDLQTGPPVSNLQIYYPAGKGAPSGNLKQGANFGVYGTITDGIEIQEVYGGVYSDSTGLPLLDFCYTANLAGQGKTSYSLYPDFDDRIIFNNLPAGNYKWKIAAKDAENTVVLADTKFSIVGDAPPSQDSSITIANATKPSGTLKQGSNFGVYGNITSNLNITKVWGGVYNKSDGSKTAQYAEASPNAKTYSLYPTFDNKIIFNDLPAGSYIYKIEATDGVKSYELVKSEFSVGSSDSNSSMSISGETKPTGSLNQGSFFGVYGNITSNLNITKVWGGVYQSDGSTKTSQYYEDTPNAKTYSLYPTFDNKIIFNNLPVGSYVYKIQATDGSKTYTLINSSFSIVNPNAGSSMSIKNETKPTGTLKQGSFFGVYGDITSSLNITKVWGGVYYRGGGATSQYYEASPNAKTYSLYPTFDNKIIFNYLPEGQYTYMIMAKDTSGKEYTLIKSDFQVGSTPLSFTASATSFSLNRSKGDTKTITLTYKNLPSSVDSVYINASQTSSELISWKWGSGWNGTSHDVTLSCSGKTGTETVTFKLCESSTEKVLATVNVKVTITSDPLEFNASATSLSISGTATKQVTFSYKNYDGNVSIAWEHGSDRAVLLEWGSWSDNSVPLKITGDRSGTEKLTVYMKDSSTQKVLATKTITITVTGIDTKLTASTTSVSINMDKSESKSVTFSYSNEPAATHSMNLRFIHGENTATSLSWGNWENNSCKLNISGYRTGTEKVTVEFYDADTGKTLATKVITVTVSGTPKITASASSVTLKYNDSTTKDVKFTMTNIPYGCSIQAVHGDKIVSSYTWQGWNNGTNTIRFTSTAPGTEVYTINLLSSDKKVVVSTKVTVTVTAQFTVKFDANGGTVSTASKSVSYDANYGDLPTPTFTGHVFGGWYTSKTGGNLVDKNTTVAITANQTLYAHWTLNSYAVTLDANGGTVSPNTIYVTYSKQYGSIPSPSKDGYVFNGWYTAKSNGTKITSTTTVTTNKDHTLYALWKFQPQINGTQNLKLENGSQFTLMNDPTGMTFSSSNTSVAVISKSGVITAISEGTSIISIISPESDVYQVNLTVTAPNETIGDINADGSIDKMDVEALRDHLITEIVLDDEALFRADINGDKKVNAIDLTLLKRLVLSK